MEDRTSLVGTTIEGRFEVQQDLGEERGSQLFAGRQVATGREVMVRAWGYDAARDADAVRDSLRQLRAAGALRHPNTATVYGYGSTPDGLLYVASESLPGETLRNLLDREGRLPLERAAQVAAEICGSLTEAHAIGMLHGGLTPAAVVVEERGADPPRVRVRDYGLGALLQPEARRAAGHIAGIDRHDYLSPEVTDGERKPDARSDLYSLGVILFEMLVGRSAAVNPQLGTSLWEVQSDLQIPIGIDQILAASLARSPDLRLPSAGVFRERLEAAVARQRQDPRRVRIRKLSEYRRRLAEASELSFAGDEAPQVNGNARVTGPTPLPPVRLRRHSHQRTLLYGLVGLLVLVGGALAAVFLTPHSAPTPDATPTAVEAADVAGGRPAAGTADAATMAAPRVEDAGATPAAAAADAAATERAVDAAPSEEPTAADAGRTSDTAPAVAVDVAAPAKPEPTKPEPAKPEPTKPEPTKPEPTKPEPTKPEPAKPEPAKPEPTKPEPAKPEPTVVPPKPQPEPTKPEPTVVPPKPKPKPVAPKPKPEPVAPKPKPEPEPPKPKPEPPKPKPEPPKTPEKKVDLPVPDF